MNQMVEPPSGLVAQPIQPRKHSHISVSRLALQKIEENESLVERIETLRSQKYLWQTIAALLALIWLLTLAGAVGILLGGSIS